MHIITPVSFKTINDAPYTKIKFAPSGVQKDYHVKIRVRLSDHPSAKSVAYDFPQITAHSPLESLKRAIKLVGAIKVYYQEVDGNVIV